MAGRESVTDEIKLLEEEVALAELRMRKAEATVRLLVANERLRELKANRPKAR